MNLTKHPSRVGAWRLHIDEKRVRAGVIAAYLERNRMFGGVVCFTCGNAGAALRKAGVNVLTVGVGQDVSVPDWWGQERIRNTWPHLFDATSGHLPVEMMGEIGELLRCESLLLNTLDRDEPIYVASGSGETVVALSMVFPEHSFVAEYDNRVAATRFSLWAPLSALVQRMCEVEIRE